MYAVYVQYVLKFPETRSTSSYNPLFQKSCTIAGQLLRGNSPAIQVQTNDKLPVFTVSN